MLFCGWMSIEITFSGMLGGRPTVSDLFRRPERENRPLYTVSSVGDITLQSRYSRRGNKIYKASKRPMSDTRCHKAVDTRSHFTWMCEVFP